MACVLMWMGRAVRGVMCHGSSPLEELFQMAAREERQEEPHQRMVTIGPEKGYALPHYQIEDQNKENQRDNEETRFAKSPHGVSFLAL